VVDEDFLKKTLYIEVFVKKSSSMKRVEMKPEKRIKNRNNHEAAILLIFDLFQLFRRTLPFWFNSSHSS